MKAFITVLAIFFALIYFVSPFEVTSFDLWQVPLWLADLSWTGIELAGAALVVVMLVMAALVISLGLFGFIAFVIACIIFTLILGLSTFAWPLLLLILLCWLLSDNKKYAA